MSNAPKKLDRRKFLYAGLGTAIVVVGGLAAYFATRPPERIVETVEKPVEKTIVQTQVQTVEKPVERTITQTVEKVVKEVETKFTTIAGTPTTIVETVEKKVEVTKPGATLIDFWVFGGTTIEEHPWLSFITEQFNSAHPDIQVRRTGKSWATKYEEILAAYKAGTAPDLFTTDATAIGDYVEAGLVVPLDVEFPEVLKWEERFVPEIWKNSATWWKGHLYAIPPWVDAFTFLAYNKEHFKQAGIVDSKGDPTPPRTWDELMEFSKLLTKKDKGIYGYAFPVKVAAEPDSDVLTGIAYQNGARWLSEDEKTVVLDDPGWVDTVQFHVDLVKAGVVPPNPLDIGYIETNQLFFAGKLSMQSGASWIPVFPKYLGVPPDYPYDISLFPKRSPISGSYPPASMIMGAMMGMFMTSTSKHKKEAFEFMKWFASEEVLIGWDGSHVRGRIPALKKAYESVTYKVTYPALYNLYHEGVLFKGALQLPTFLGLVEMKEPMLAAWQEAVAGKKSPKDALRDAKTKAQRIYDAKRK
ncbi:MAG: extracellular solute-binding protein [Nitrososphaerales archaeon]